MRYEFPPIRTIDDVLPHIKDSQEFIVVDKGDYKVINYAVAFEDTFPEVKTVGDAIRRECRGLIFAADGTILARRYHKFFNVNEREETLFEKIDLGQPHRILEKLDGSMISPILIGGEWKLTTKMGITDVAQNAQAFWDAHPSYAGFVERTLASYRYPNTTCIFEWCSNKNRIVVDYPEDRLVLTAIRDNVTGGYMPYEDLVRWAKMNGIDYVKAYEPTPELLKHVGQLEDEEGIVIRFEDGHMYKLKSEWYVLRHKSKDAITREKNVLDYVVNEKVDDILPFLTEADQKRIRVFEHAFWEGVRKIAKSYGTYFQKVKEDYPEKRDWAINEMPYIRGIDTFAPPVIFAMYGGTPAGDAVLQIIRKNINTTAHIENVRYLWDYARWEYTYEGDN